MSKAPLATQPADMIGDDLPVTPAPLSGDKGSVARNPVVRKAKGGNPFVGTVNMTNWDVLPSDITAMMES